MAEGKVTAQDVTGNLLFYIRIIHFSDLPSILVLKTAYYQYVGKAY